MSDYGNIPYKNTLPLKSQNYSLFESKWTKNQQQNKRKKTAQSTVISHKKSMASKVAFPGRRNQDQS